MCVKIAKSLELAGHRAGLLISPHISSFRERISINGTFITENEVVVHNLPKTFEICEENKIPATFFEMVTGLAFKYFADSSVDVVVLETGLGGRLDATNVVRKPDLCIITSIGLEHTAILGDTVEKIAAEKAGIIKNKIPILVGPNVPHKVIRKIAHEKGAEGYYISDDVIEDKDLSNTQGYTDYDIENSRTAKAAIKLLQSKSRDESIFPAKLMSNDILMKGVSQRPTCRFEEIEILSEDEKQIRKATVVMDIAHKPPCDANISC